MSSLRSRLFLGSVLWMFGLLFVVNLVATSFVQRDPTDMHMRRLAHLAAMSAVAVGFGAAGLWAVRKTLSPFQELRERLSAVRDGRDRRIGGEYPAEVQPLVDDLNSLLEARERRVARALAKAGDLAHGLKTPLAVLSQEAERAEADGHSALAATIGQQVDRMKGQVDYHLAHARAAASGSNAGARCTVLVSAEGLARTLLRLHAGRGIAIDLHVSPDHAIRGERADLDEMLGNLLDNACTWARSRVEVRSARDGADILVTIDDDGPGLAPSLWDRVLKRGVRADEAAPGSGFGLAIVRDLAELYGGSIVLDHAAAGGLSARLRLPSA